MKIVHVAQYLNPGMGYQENLLPYYQQQLGHEVVLITSTLSSGFNQKAKRKFPAGETLEHGFRVIRLPVWGELKDKFVLFKGLARILEQEKPDYIWQHMPTTLSVRTVCQYKKSHPDVFLAIDNHADLTISIHNRFLKTVYYNGIWKTLLRLWTKPVDLFFGVTPSRCLFLEEELGIDPDKIRLLPIGTDTDHFQPVIDRAQFLASHHLTEDQILIVHGGKMTRDKQVDRIVRAFQRIPNSNVRLILFGSIEDPSLQTLINQDSRVLALGWLNRQDTLTVLIHSHFGIWNTRHTTLLEDSLAAGLPLVLRYYGSTCHLIDDSGLFLYEGSIHEIQEKMQLLIDHPELLAAFRSATQQLGQALSYPAIAQESVAYAQSPGPLAIHQTFMTDRFSDPGYEQYRKIRES
ncbi:MAG: glycosyltransferase family 4 protein [Eubacteriales bacterium]|nr:glycosyltransferase family 4 protein [Eubacteriales bacterium]